jgi:diphthamide biosynthesis methyltransferase
LLISLELFWILYIPIRAGSVSFSFAAVIVCYQSCTWYSTKDDDKIKANRDHQWHTIYMLEKEKRTENMNISDQISNLEVRTRKAV